MISLRNLSSALTSLTSLSKSVAKGIAVKMPRYIEIFAARRETLKIFQTDL